MSELYKKIGESGYEQLLADPQGADVIAVPVEPGHGVLPRGILLYRKNTGFWAPAATSQMSTSYELAVLNETVDSGESLGEAPVAEDAAAYRAGSFIDGKVLYYNSSAGEYQKVTAAHKLVLRQLNIVFDQWDAAEAFNNGGFTVTYKANNDVTPAEDDVVVAVLAGDTHTILGNSGANGTGFTAPATKSFSKWNTKADGTGTDYAAAGSYTASADLVLFAVWA